MPGQGSPQGPIDWQAVRLAGQDALAVRASKKLRNDALFETILAGTELRRYLDRIPLWRGNHVPLKQLAEDFAQYLYLPRLQDPSVLVEACQHGLGLLTWSQDSFAYADSWDEATGRYRGLRAGQALTLSANQLTGLLVRPEVARQQLEAEAAAAATVPIAPAHAPPLYHPTTRGDGATAAPLHAPLPARSAPVLNRFHGSVTLDPTRVGRDAGRIADEVIAHLAGLVGANVRVTLEIEVEIPAGAPDNVVRIVTENSRTLKFSTQGFEPE